MLIYCIFALKLHLCSKALEMTKEIIIRKPSAQLQNMIEVMKDKKRQQIKKLSQDKACIFSITVD